MDHAIKDHEISLKVVQRHPEGCVTFLSYVRLGRGKRKSCRRVVAKDEAKKAGTQDAFTVKNNHIMPLQSVDQVISKS